MKKLVYFAAPLMVLPFLVGCGSKAPTHKVTGVEGINLDFTTMNGKELKDSSFNEKQDFKFKVKAHQDSGELSDTYKVLPDAIAIYVGDSLMPLTEGYTVEFTKDDETEAIVTVQGSKVTSNIYIEGMAKKKDYFIYNVPLLHNVKIGTNIKSFGYMPKVTSSDDKNGDIGFVGADADHARPKSEDFVVSSGEYFYVDTDDWFKAHVNVKLDTGSDHTTLEIKGIQENDAVEYVLIAAKSSSDTLLESFDWDEIRYIAHEGYATYLFNIGDTKKVTINELDYTVRIIGFNHDMNKDGEIAPITFQFVEAISNASKQGKYMPTTWDTKTNVNFPDSGLNKTSLTDLFGALPGELQRNIMEVQKEVGAKPKSTWDIAHYQTNLFPLSHAEMSAGKSDYDKDGEGTIYPYYSTHTDQKDRIVHDKKGDAVTYWLRTPTINGGNNAWAVDTVGEWKYNSQSVKTTHAVVPAFCI